jgi:hypothetical protein
VKKVIGLYPCPDVDTAGTQVVSHADGHYYRAFEDTLEPGEVDQNGNTYVWIAVNKEPPCSSGSTL